MKGFESWLLTYLLNSLWQVPLLFAAGWLAARALKPAGAAAEHRGWVTVLLLQSLIPVCSSLPLEWLQAVFAWSRDTHAGHADVSVVMGGGTALAGMRLPAGLLTAVTLVYVAALIYFASRFLLRFAKLSAIRREAIKMPLAGAAASWCEHCSARFGIDNVSIATSTRIFGPVTIGFLRKLVLLPAEMGADLPEAELHAAIAHEFAHLRRNDFLKNLAYELLSLPMSYHPVVWLTRERITESREMVCDQMAAEISGRNQYARSLLRLAAMLVHGVPGTTPHAIGILDANAFERRVMKLTKKQNQLRGSRRFAAVLACAALAVGTCALAMALSMHVEAGSVAASDTARHHEPINVSAAEMASNKISGPVPKYPEEAKKERIQGTVVLDAVIGKDGTVEELTVASGPKELQRSALDAVRQWKYKPFLLNGDPVDVKTTINVIYSLSDD
jgi:TonB family protein